MSRMSAAATRRKRLSQLSDASWRNFSRRRTIEHRIEINRDELITNRAKSISASAIKK